MRVSTNYIYMNTRRTMQRSISNLLDVQEIMASQRKVNHISDDPVAAGGILNVNAMIEQHDQFIENLGLGSTYSELYDGAFNGMVEVLSRAKELLLQEANSATSTSATREAARVEIVSLASQLVSVGNLQYSNQFLFAGFANDTAPFEDLTVATAAGGGNTGGAAVVVQSINDPALVTGDTYQVQFTAPGTFDIVNTTTGIPVSTGNAYTSGETFFFDGISLRIEDSPGPPAAGDVFDVSTTPAGNYLGDSGVIELEIEQDVWHQVNMTGDRVFQGVGLPNGVDLFDIFERANLALRNNDQVEIQNLLEEFDQGLEQTTALQSLVGARESLFEKTTDRLSDVKMNMEIHLSELRDVDVTEAVTELNRQENAYQAVLNAASKVLQPNLLDFLR